MLAVDHGYFQGPTTGLERIDLSIVPLLPQCDALFCTRGILRSRHPRRVAKADGAARQRRPQHPARGALRRADRHGHGRCRAPQRGGRRHPGVRRRRARDALGAQHDEAGGRGPARRHARHGHHRRRQGHGARRASISGSPAASSPSSAPSTSRPTTWSEDFETVTASCPVPIVMAGGKKLPELEALTMAYNAVQPGRRRRRHGPQHLPVRRAQGHDRRRLPPSCTRA